MEPMILRHNEMVGWRLFSANGRFMASIPDYYAFMDGWMASDPRRIEVQVDRHNTPERPQEGASAP